MNANTNTTLILTHTEITAEEDAQIQARFQALLADGWGSDDAAHAACLCDTMEDALHYLERFLRVPRGRASKPRPLADPAAGVPDGLDAQHLGVDRDGRSYHARVAVGQSASDPSRGGAVVPASDGATGYVLHWRHDGERFLVWGCSCTDALRHGGGCKHEGAAREALNEAVNAARHDGDGAAQVQVQIYPVRRGSVARRWTH